ncbi:MAG: threonine ammonia-lyase [Planctomycetota bacterium]|jgi:threonine dehydratase
MAWPIRFQDVLDARERIGRWLRPTPLRSHPALDRESGLRLLVKHEEQNPTRSFKARNGLSVLTALDPGPRARGVVAATRGNHGLGLAWAGQRLGVPVTICVPHGNSPLKNAAIRELGAELVEEGRDYDEALDVARRLVRERGLQEVHSTNEPLVIAGAATLSLEIVEAAPRLDAMVLAVGGGSQAVGALTVVRALRPEVEVYGVQAAGAPAIHDSWHARRPLTRPAAETFADGLATRRTYELTFGPLCEGLRDFVLVSEGEIADALRTLRRHAGTTPEGAGAAGFAGVRKLGERLAGRTVAVVISGANLDEETLRRVLGGS